MVDKNDMFEKVQELFEDVDISSVVYGGCDSFNDYYDYEMLDNFAIEIGADCRSGVTKMVFFFDEFPDYVIKIPFRGMSCQDEDYEIYDKQDFYGADARFKEKNIHSWDYCETEARYYKLAIKENVSEFFAGTFFLGMIQDYPIYYSERVERSLEDLLWDNDTLFADNQSSEIASELCEKYGYDVTETKSFEEAVGYMVEEYGKEKVDNFLNFIKSNDIVDLHSGNFGIHFDGSVKVIDYSSWRH